LTVYGEITETVIYHSELRHVTKCHSEFTEFFCGKLWYEYQQKLRSKTHEV